MDRAGCEGAERQDALIELVRAVTVGQRNHLLIATLPRLPVAEGEIGGLGEQQVDVALIDFNMAEKDGLELAAELREAHPELPIAIITANIQDEIIARARAINAAFVAKPITKEGLDGFVSGAALRLRSKNQ